MELIHDPESEMIRGALFEYLRYLGYWEMPEAESVPQAYKQIRARYRSARSAAQERDAVKF